MENLKVCFRLPEGKVEALKGASFFIEEGEIYCLLGQSGSGKSTIAKAVMRLLPPSAEVSGQVLFKGVDLLSIPEDEMRHYRGRRISIIFQEPMTSLNPTMRVGDQVAEVLTLHLGMKKEKAMVRVKELFEELSIPEPEKRLSFYPHMLSGGMRQRVMIAMALAASPELVLADEPTTALDVTVQAQILALIKALVKKKGTSLLFITHDFGVACEMADRIGVLFNGLLVEEGRTDEVVSAPCHPYTRDLMKAVPTFGKGGFEVSSGLKSPQAEGCPYAGRCSKATKRCLKESPDWVFVSETHRVRCFYGNA